MIKIYFLPVERINNTDIVRGSEYIHNAILDCTEKPDIRKLIMETTPEEDTALSALAIEIREPTEQESSNFEALPSSTPSPKDLATEIDELKARVEKLEQK